MTPSIPLHIQALADAAVASRRGWSGPLGMTMTAGPGEAQLMHSIPEALKVLGGVSRSTFYELVQAGQLVPIKLGRRTYVTHAELERFVHNLAELNQTAAG